MCECFLDSFNKPWLLLFSSLNKDFTYLFIYYIYRHMLKKLKCVNFGLCCYDKVSLFLLSLVFDFYSNRFKTTSETW